MIKKIAVGAAVVAAVTAGLFVASTQEVEAAPQGPLCSALSEDPSVDTLKKAGFALRVSGLSTDAVAGYVVGALVEGCPQYGYLLDTTDA